MRRTPARRRFLLSLGVIWACFLIRALFYCAAIPLWEGFDEYAHFDYVRHIALKRSLPNRDTRISPEVAESLQLAPPGLDSEGLLHRRSASYSRRLLAVAGGGARVA